MIIYGQRATSAITELTNEKCTNCQSRAVSVHVFQKYAHVFWIPFFALGKTGVTECAHCKLVLNTKEMPEEFRIVYKGIAARQKPPVWMFSGLLLVALLIVVGVFSNQKSMERNAKMILTPQKNDVYEIKESPSHYTLYKVFDVKGDSVFINPSNYEMDKANKLYKLKNETYASEVLIYTKAQLKSMLEKKDIMDIDRN